MSQLYTRVPVKGGDPTPFIMDLTTTGTAANTTTVYLVERLHGYSICANIIETVASLAGTLKLQASNNAFADNVSMQLNPNAVWVDIPSSTVTLTAGSTQAFWNSSQVYYEAVKIVWTHTTGAGTLTPYFLAKAV